MGGEKQILKEHKMNTDLPSFAEIKELTDREVLFIMLEKLRQISANQTNHLHHHWTITLVCAAAALSGIFNLGIAFLIIFFKVR